MDLATGFWGVWMPGFMQFLAGTYLFLGLTLFGTFTASPPLYMAALAFTAFGVHWFALGWIRLRRADARATIGMTVAFLALSVLGIIVFFKAGDNPVGGLSSAWPVSTPLSSSPRWCRTSRASGRPSEHSASSTRHRNVADLPGVRGRAGLHPEVHAACMSRGAGRSLSAAGRMLRPGEPVSVREGRR